MVVRRSLFVVVATLAWVCAHGKAVAQSPSPAPSCAKPFVDARTTSVATPIVPLAAMQQGVSGEVIVQITLDEHSKIVDATIVQSPSPLLNKAALDAARASTFATRIIDCVPVGDSYDFVVDFQATGRLQPGPPAAMVAYFSGAWNCATAGGSLLVRVFGLDPTKRAFSETDAFNDTNGDVLRTSASYEQVGNELFVFGRLPSGTYAGRSYGWSHDHLVFDVIPTSGSSVRGMVTYERVDASHFRVTVGKIDATAEANADRCERIVPPVPAR
jgi:TonB family protein